MKQKSPQDPKGLIHDAYAIEGITDAECRSILIDWALSLPMGVDQRDAATVLAAGRAADHPMTALLQQASAPPPARGRRGGWAGRRSAEG